MLALGMGLGLSRPQGQRFSPASEALFARMSVQPSYARKGLYDRVLRGLTAAGVAGKADAIHLEAAHDAQASRLNILADQFNLTAVNSPTFTVDRGYTGNGTSSYLATGIVPSVLDASGSAKMKQNSANLSIFTKGFSGADGTLAGCRNGGSTFFDIYAYANGTGASFRPNAPPASSTDFPVPNGNGLFTANRSSSTTVETYSNGVLLGSVPSASTASPTTEALILAKSNGAPEFFANVTVMASIFGGSLTGTEMAAAYAIIRDYLIAVGALP